MLVLDGKKASAFFIEKIKKSYHDFAPAIKKNLPNLTIVSIGDSPQSAVYVKAKVKMCHQLGFQCEEKKLPATVSQKDVTDTLQIINQNHSVSGIIVQLPLPAHLSEDELIAHINPIKDVDGLSHQSMGQIILHQEGLIPATPLGIIMLMDYYHINTKRKHVVILGRSRIVGKPLSIMLSNSHRLGEATVTLCHSHTPDITRFTKMADILIVAVGKPLMLTKEMISPGVTIIDVGINKIEAVQSNNSRIVGDVDYEHVAPLCHAISPVPGGVGKMTVAALMHNVLQAYAIQNSIKFSSPLSL